ncbi:MAG: phosphatase PAP2 family protein [Planctomycetia bacterium]
MTAPLRPSTDTAPGRDRPAARWSPRALVSAAVVLAFLGLAAFAIDLPVAAWCKSGGVPKELLRFLNFCEVFAHTMGAAALLVTALVLDPGLAFPAVRWPAIRWPTFQPTAAQERMARMIGATACGGLVVDLIKLCVSRARPRAIDLASHASAVTTFGLIPGTGRHADAHSFPSGHAAVACGLYAALAWRYPRGRWLFLVFAAGAALQRVATSAHYPSDICFGAALGLVGGGLFLADRAATADTRTAS